MRAEPAAADRGAEPAVAGTPRDGARWLLPAGGALLVAVLAIYLADLATHLSSMAALRDLVVYRNGGLIVRHVAPAYDSHRASPLYDWTGRNGVQFTYPPFAAVVFAAGSVLSWTAMRWAMTLASLAALGLSLQQTLVLLEDTLALDQGQIATGLIQVYRGLGGGWQIRCTGCEPTLLTTLGVPQAAPEAPSVLQVETAPAPVPGTKSKLP